MRPGGHWKLALSFAASQCRGRRAGPGASGFGKAGGSRVSPRPGPGGSRPLAGRGQPHHDHGSEPEPGPGGRRLSRACGLRALHGARLPEACPTRTRSQAAGMIDIAALSPGGVWSQAAEFC